MGLALTVGLGAVFSVFQGIEYAEATFAFSENIYGATFYMATGFHGFHVIVGTLFLLVCLIRANQGDFTAEKHNGLEAAAWYWHFVDVVWLFLFAAIYVWGAGTNTH
jgi:Heme/copper-type cytochrome/quinol oxidase, subunit 3